MLVSDAELRSLIETDLPPSALVILENDAEAAIVSRYGANYPGPITKERLGINVGFLSIPTIYLERAALTITSVTEIIGDPFLLNEVATVLDPADYRLLPGGRMIQRLLTGPNPRWEGWTGWSGRVDVVYVPVDDTAQRKRTIVDLVKLAIRYNAAKMIIAGDYREAAYDDYTQERRNLIEESGPQIAFS